eukprot:gnl/MRDRNA2_/MRDRNA2_14944_c0_seq1.p1 gnl/MRDRNA2_/MRDRNA2_14944_c0~~gnl/MRDRNA2_/MRDRNA2_14944_c0_seq1.p1  ORF type:complete len:227 (+),score=49.76 gnl/MRDRNA2_/MRDRNA2_14944_c0_seq1:33-683(+)
MVAETKPQNNRVDGVLHPLNGPYCFTEDCMKHLRELVSMTGADIVLSSDWRRNDGKADAVNKILHQWGIPACLPQKAGWTFCGKDSENLLAHTSADSGKVGAEARAAEIMAWVKEHPVETSGGWVALDDLDLKGWHAPAAAPSIDDHFVHTDPSTGLTSRDVQRALEVIGGPKTGLCPLPPPAAIPAEPLTRGAIENFILRSAMMKFAANPPVDRE